MKKNRSATFLPVGRRHPGKIPAKCKKQFRGVQGRVFESGYSLSPSFPFLKEKFHPKVGRYLERVQALHPSSWIAFFCFPQTRREYPPRHARAVRLRQAWEKQSSLKCRAISILTRKEASTSPVCPVASDTPFLYICVDFILVSMRRCTRRSYVQEIETVDRPAGLRR